MKFTQKELNEPLVQTQSKEKVLELKTMKYSKYLRSKYWEEVRRKMHGIVGYECEICGVKEYIHVHHFHYASLGEETLNDLACLCEQCHLAVHNSEAALFVDTLYSRETFQNRLNIANKTKKNFSNKKFLKLLPLTQKAAWEVKQLQFFFDCSSSEVRDKYEEEIKDKLVVKTYVIIWKTNFEFYSLDRFIWHVIRLDFPKVE